MKKFATILLSVLLCFTSLFMFACKEDEKEVKIEYTSPDAVISKLCDDKIKFGLLPEPAATKLEKIDGSEFTWHRISLQELYDEEQKAYPQAVLMVKNSVLNDYPQLVSAVKEKFNSSTHLVGVKQAISNIKGEYNLLNLPAFVDDEMVEKCNIWWQDATESSTQTQVKTYIDKILEIDIGLGIKPATAIKDDFFYVNNTGVGQVVDGKTFTFCVPGGAPALSIVNFIDNGENFVEGANFNYKVVNADNIAMHMNGEVEFADFIILPINAASKLYNKKTDLDKSYKMVSVITHGNMYIMSKTQSNINSLKGNTISIFNKEGTVPDLTLKIVLNKNGIKHSTKA